MTGESGRSLRCKVIALNHPDVRKAKQENVTHLMFEEEVGFTVVAENSGWISATVGKGYANPPALRTRNQIAAR
jgi:hypothetical protein